MWKNDILTQMDQNLHAPPIFYSKSNQLSHPAPYQRLWVRGFLHKEMAMVRASQVHKGRVGIRWIIPLVLEDHRVLWIDWGWAPKKEAFSPLPSSQEKQVTLLVRAHYPQPKGTFTPHNDLANGVIFHMDLASFFQIHKTLGHPLPFYGVLLEKPQDGTAKGEPYPIISETLQRPPNNHLGYALTWYGLALLWLFFAWRMGRGR